MARRQGEALFGKAQDIGAWYLPHNMPPELRGDAQFWAKVGVEGILYYFGVPEGHDSACFFHPEGCSCLAVEDARKYYCLKCREFMGRLESPLDVARICSEAEEIYGLASTPGQQKRARRPCEGSLTGSGEDASSAPSGHRGQKRRRCSPASLLVYLASRAAKKAAAELFGLFVGALGHFEHAEHDLQEHAVGEDESD